MGGDGGRGAATGREETGMDRDEATGKATGGSRRRRLASVGLVASGLLAGGILAGSHIAGAQSNASTTASSAATVASTGGTDPANMRHGPGETLLTDGTASRVRAAALAAVPGGTIIRVETDSAGSPYEAHVRKSDGTIVTVKIDRAFKVTSTQSGFGGGPRSDQSN
jgi:hypothetical protein